MLRRLAVVLAVSLSPSLALAIDITSCDQLVPTGQTGEVRNDLDCSGGHFAAVRLAHRAKLRLNGFRLNGPTTSGTVVFFERSGAVYGPGVVHDDTIACIGTYGDGDLIVDGGTGLEVYGCQYGIGGSNRAKVSNVHAHDNSDIGVSAVKLVARDVTANDNRVGLSGGISLRATDVTANGNEVTGASGGESVNLKRFTAAANGRGADGRRVVLADTTITGSFEVGVYAYVLLRVRNSTVSGTGPGTGDFPPNVDLLVTDRKPVVTNTVCDKSSNGVESWGVCAND